jgi:protocadherin Fat 4
VTIILKDVNDMAPEFVTSNETSVMENVPVNTVVMAIKAIDKDEGRNSYIEYSLAPVVDGCFSLGPVDGLLRVYALLDRENRSNYTLHVTAYDRGLPSRTTVRDYTRPYAIEANCYSTFKNKQRYVVLCYFSRWILWCEFWTKTTTVQCLIRNFTVQAFRKMPLSV